MEEADLRGETDLRKMLRDLLSSVQEEIRNNSQGEKLKTEV